MQPPPHVARRMVLTAHQQTTLGKHNLFAGLHLPQHQRFDPYVNMQSVHKQLMYSFDAANILHLFDQKAPAMLRMLATCMNALSLQAALEHVGVETRVQTAIEMRVSGLH